MPWARSPGRPWRDGAWHDRAIGTGYCQLTVTAPTAEEAERLARLGVEARLAACAQVSGPVRSTYWWKGEVTASEEWVCTFKTTGPQAQALRLRLREAHSYEVPEIVVTEIDEGDPDYLSWIAEETAGGGPAD